MSQSANRVRVSAALAERIEAYSALLPGAQALAPARHDRMPYRMFFGQIGERLKATYEGRPNAYQSPEELLADVQLAADSLADNRGRHAGYFLVRRLMRRVRTFGFHLATLDVIQHAHVHDEVIAQGLGMPRMAGAAAARSGCAQLRDLLARDQGPTTPLDAIGRRSPVGVRGHRSGAAQVRRPRHRRIHRERRRGPRGRAGGAAAGALGRYHRQAHRRVLRSTWRRCSSRSTPWRAPASCCAALHDEPAYRRHLAARGNRQMGGDRLFRHQQAGRHRGLALGAAGGAAPAAGGGARHRHHDHDISRPRRHAGARRRPHRELGRSGAERRDSRRAALDRAGRGRQSELRPAADRDAHLERTFAAVALATAHARHAAARSPPAQLAAMQTIAAHSLDGLSPAGVRRSRNSSNIFAPRRRSM